MELHRQTSCVFVGGALFFGFFAAMAMVIGTDGGWTIGGVLMLLPLALVLMSRRGVTIDPSARLIEHHNGIGSLRLRKRHFEVNDDCEVVLLDYESEIAPGGYVVYVREGRRRLDLLLTQDGPDADALVTALADELRLRIVDRYEKRARRGAVLESREQPREV